MIKKILVLVMLVCLIVGCATSEDSYKMLKNIEKEFPDSKIINLRNCDYKFLVKKSDGTIWYIESYGSNGNISYKIQLF